VSWPSRITEGGGIRTQFSHLNAIAATIYEATGIAFPAVVDGVEQTPVHGPSLVYTFHEPLATSRHRTQLFELAGNRAIYHDGWLAGARHADLPANGPAAHRSSTTIGGSCTMRTTTSARPSILPAAIRRNCGTAATVRPRSAQDGCVSVGSWTRGSYRSSGIGRLCRHATCGFHTGLMRDPRMKERERTSLLAGGIWRAPAHWTRITTIDVHTCGEPLRVITSDLPPIEVPMCSRSVATSASITITSGPA
jgi:hypothetical protein